MQRDVQVRIGQFFFMSARSTFIDDISHIRRPGLGNSTPGLVICAYNKSWDLSVHISGTSGPRKKCDLSTHIYPQRHIHFYGHSKDIMNAISGKCKRSVCNCLRTMSLGILGSGDKLLTRCGDLFSPPLDMASVL